MPLSLFGRAYHASNNGKLQNVGLSMQNGKGPCDINLQTYPKKITISGTSDAVDGFTPYVARAFLQYTLDVKKNGKA